MDGWMDGLNDFMNHWTWFITHVGMTCPQHMNLLHTLCQVDTYAGHKRLRHRQATIADWNNEVSQHNPT